VATPKSGLQHDARPDGGRLEALPSACGEARAGRVGVVPRPRDDARARATRPRTSACVSR
jgi:hypothetical protein